VSKNVAALSLLSLAAGLSPVRPGAGEPGRCRAFGEPPGDDPAAGAAVADPPITAKGLEALVQSIKDLAGDVKTVGPRLQKLEEADAQRARDVEAIVKTHQKRVGLPGYSPSGNPDKDFSIARAIRGHYLRWTEESGTRQFPEFTLLNEYREHIKGMDGAVASHGGFLVPATFMDKLVEELLPATVALQMGVENMTGLTGGDLVMPSEKGGITVYRKGETQQGTQSAETYGDLTLRRKELIALTKVSNGLLNQTAGRARTYVERKMARKIGLRIDKDFFIGSGSQFIPTGISQVTGIKTVSWSGVTFTGATQNITDKLEDMKLQLKKVNSYRGRMVWVAAPDVFAKFRKCKDSQGRPVFFDANTAKDGATVEGQLFYGLPYFETTQLTAGNPATLLLVAVEDCLMGMWDTMEIAVSDSADGVFLSNELMIRAIAYQDSLLLHPEGVCSATSLDAS